MKRKSSSEVAKSRVGKKMKPLPQRVYTTSSARSGEKKWLDTAASATSIGTTGTIIASSLNLLSAGTGESQLVGRKMTIKTVQLKGNITVASASNATLSNLVEDIYTDVYLLLDKQANGAAATIANVFQNTDIRTFKDLENSKRFSVLKKWQVRCHRDVNHDGTSYFVGAVQEPMEELYHPCTIDIDYGATPSGVIGDVKSNNLFLAGFTSNGSATTIDYRVRVRYLDN